MLLKGVECGNMLFVCYIFVCYVNMLFKTRRTTFHHTQTSGMDVSKQSGSMISFHDVQDSLSTFSGDDTYPISKWIEDIEELADIMNWSDVELFVFGNKLLTSIA